jgi:hypothetical protein
MKYKFMILTVIIVGAGLLVFWANSQKMPYSALADRIATGLTQAVNRGEREWSIENNPSTEVLLLSEGYVLTSSTLAATGLVSQALATRLASNNAENDGVYLQLAAGDRVRAFLALPPGFQLPRHFIVIRPKDRISFQIHRTSKGKILIEVR